MQGVPPPRIHVHLRLYDVARDVPIGTPQGAEEASPPERAVFDKWLLERWQEKDALMEMHLTKGGFRSSTEAPTASSVPIAGSAKDMKKWDEEKGGNGAVEWPIRLNSKAEILEAFSWFGPVVFGVTVWRLAGLVKGTA